MKVKNNVAISNSGFVFNSNSGESFSSNPIGTEIINLLKEDKSYEEIKTFVIDKYNVDEATFEKDYNDFLSVLNSFSITENNE